MSSYVTYYVVVPPVEVFPALMLIHAGTTDDGLAVYNALDPQEEAVEHIYNCWQCYDSQELLFGDYPEMAGTVTVERDGESVDIPRLSGGWC